MTIRGNDITLLRITMAILALIFLTSMAVYHPSISDIIANSLLYTISLR